MSLMTGVRYKCRICKIEGDVKKPTEPNTDKDWHLKLPKDWTNPKPEIFLCERCSGNHNY